MLRSHTCGELRKSHAGKKVKLSGWVDTIRSHGKITFIDLRDRYGITQVVLPDLPGVDKLKNESIILVKGQVNARPKGTINPKIDTGEVEVKAESLKVLNNPPSLPFEVNDRDTVGEEVRMKYRYLDLRRPRMQKNIILRHRIKQAVREFMDQKGFLDIETPTLTKSTPEGSRDYLVPSRRHPGKFYALPQSPQLFKQLLMVSGFDKYYQLARCWRDEDLRKDRQPEFTQIDLEMSFIDEQDIQDLVEEMLKHVFKKVLGVSIKTPFPRITYAESMAKYGNDKPDLRKNKADPKEFAFCWVVDWPLFEWSEEEGRLTSAHHPFTMPQEDSIPLLDKDPGKVMARAYDVVLNGFELGGGSIRITDSKLQEKIFKVLAMDKKEVKERFGFLLGALKYAPPHGGLAIGLDRLAMLMTGEENIREVIPFIYNKTGRDLMTGAPDSVRKRQLDELHISVKKPKK